MAGRYGRKDEDFDEDEVWGVMEENRENNNIISTSKLRKNFMKNSSFDFSASSSSSPRMIPRSSSSSSSTTMMSSEKQSSAPVEIPDWSKIYGKNSKKKKNGVVNSNGVNYDDVCYGNGGSNDHHHHHGYYNGYYDDGVNVDVNGNVNDDDGDDDDDDVVPPHEFLARKLARSQISSFSVYEGIGRTLKGRDLSKVRNAILTKTGFLE